MLPTEAVNTGTKGNIIEASRAFKRKSFQEMHWLAKQDGSSVKSMDKQRTENAEIWKIPSHTLLLSSYMLGAEQSVFCGNILLTIQNKLMGYLSSSPLYKIPEVKGTWNYTNNSLKVGLAALFSKSSMSLTSLGAGGT